MTAPTTPPRPADRFTPPDPVDPVDLVDLRTAWSRERELASRPGARHDDGFGWTCPDRHGWLLDGGYDRVLEPVLGSNAGGRGYYPFADLDPVAAAGLLERLPDDYLDDERQNFSPTIGALLRGVVRHPDRLRAHGYVIGPSRCDERITVTGVLLRAEREARLDHRHGDGCECHDLVAQLAGALGVDDMLAPPDEITPWWGFDRGDGAEPAEHWYRLWWD